MPFHAVLLKASAAYAKSFTVRADAWETRSDVVVFVRDEQIVHQLPADYILRVEVHPTEKAAADAVADHRCAKVGGATIHVHETAAAAPRRRGRGGAPTAVPAEGVSVRLEER